MNIPKTAIAMALMPMLAASVIRPACAEKRKVTLVVRAPKHAYKNTPVSVLLPADAVPSTTGYWHLTRADKQGSLRAQLAPEADKIRLTFLLNDLPKGAEQTYTLEQVTFKAAPKSVFKIEKENGDLALMLDDELCTRYVTRGGPNKPFLYPILLPGGVSMTRHWPMKEVEGETRDHPHHRGLWFTHGAVNGIDFWAEHAGTGKTVHNAYIHPTAGWVYAGFGAQTEWRAPDDTLIATDTRQIRLYLLPNGDRLLDFEITIMPNGTPLLFGDTKEGMFGLRLPDALAPSRKQGGQAINAQGDKDGAVWGKKSPWVDYWGTLQGGTYGVAIFDHPANFRHPQTWHARDYGLFTINPFGLHDFKLGPEGAGNLTVAANETLTLRYRLLFHQGDTRAAAVSEHYSNYADPPEVEIR